MSMPAFHSRATRAALLLVVFGAGHAPAVQAQPAQQACRADFAEFCTGITPGDGRILACLREHRDQLSADCKTSLETAQACADQVRQRCGSPTEGKAPDRNAMRQCLHEQRDKLPASCRSQQQPLQR